MLHISANESFVAEGRLSSQAHLFLQLPASFKSCTPFGILQRLTLRGQQ